MTDAIYFIDAIDDFDVIEVIHDFAAFDFLDTGTFNCGAHDVLGDSNICDVHEILDDWWQWFSRWRITMTLIASR